MKEQYSWYYWFLSNIAIFVLEYDIFMSKTNDQRFWVLSHDIHAEENKTIPVSYDYTTFNKQFSSQKGLAALISNVFLKEKVFKPLTAIKSFESLIIVAKNS